MIKKSRPLTYAEVISLAGDNEKEEKIKGFLKQLTKVELKEAEELKEEIRKLDLIKLKEENIISIINFLPQDASDLNKVLQGVSLNQDEVEKILEVTKKY